MDYLLEVTVQYHLPESFSSALSARTCSFYEACYPRQADFELSGRFVGPPRERLFLEISLVLDPKGSSLEFPQQLLVALSHSFHQQTALGLVYVPEVDPQVLSR